MNVEDCILSLINDLKEIDGSFHLNERYLHHLFSSRINEDYPVSLNKSSLLHPEWATHIEGVTNRKGGLYLRNKHDKRRYDKTNNGSSGFIDFAIGNVDYPEYAVEFKMFRSFNQEGLIFDYMKLLDLENNIQNAISLAVYYGHSKYSKNCEEKDLNFYLKTAKIRLGQHFNNKRKHHFFFLEVVGKDDYRLFECINNWKFRSIP